MPVPTTELGLLKGVDADDTADYLVTSLANSLTTVDGLFNNVSGHTHGGAHQGGPISSTAIANGSIANAQLGPDVARANLLPNGGFEIWQRGNGPFTSAVSADRWQPGAVGTDTLSVSRDTTNIDAGSVACAACTFTLGTGAGVSALYQKLTDLLGQCIGRQLSLSLRVRTATANAVRVALVDQSNAILAASGFHSGGGAYQTLTCTSSVLTSATTDLYLKIFFAASCTAYVDNACMVVGTQPANYVPRHPADDLARCLRYYEKLGGANATLWTSIWAGAAAQTLGQSYLFAAKKAVLPTLTKVGTWSVANCGQPTADFPDVNGFRIYASSSASGTMNFSCVDATTYITAESNP